LGTKKETVETKAENKKIKKFVYIGPVIKKGLYTPGKVVTEHFKEQLKAELTKVPNLEKLFIGLDIYASELKNIEEGKYREYKKEVIANGL